ncbi:50S ribosomal protein L13 [Candidatus Woesearchaeota archaeon]|nr:50S ribosomal protein L13 [Candidatus Woesearchaeota archaeon]
MKIYNGEGMVLGRLAGYVAKDALLGEEVAVVNCDKVIVSGKRVIIMAEKKQRWDRRGYPLKSQKMPRLSDRYVRRAIRGMLPWKITRGREAYKKVLCYIGVPLELQGKAMVEVKTASAVKLPTLHYLTVQEICKGLGGKR